MSNRVTLDVLLGMAPETAAKLPVDELAMLQDDLDDIKADLKSKSAKLAEVLAERYGAKADAKRKAAGKDSGAITLDDGDYRIKADLPKKASWDQAELAIAVKVIREIWHADPADYVTTEIKVSEAKFNAWPPEVRKLFEPARTVSTQTQTFKLEPKAKK